MSESKTNVDSEGGRERKGEMQDIDHILCVKTRNIDWFNLLNRLLLGGKIPCSLQHSLAVAHPVIGKQQLLLKSAE